MDARADHLSLPIAIQQDLRLLFSRKVFATDNAVLTEVLTPRDEGVVPRVLVFWDGGLAHAFPDLPNEIVAWFEAHPQVARLEGRPHRVPGGEHSFISTSYTLPAGYDVERFLAFERAPLTIDARSLADAKRD